MYVLAAILLVASATPIAFATPLIVPPSATASTAATAAAATTATATTSPTLGNWAATNGYAANAPGHMPSAVAPDTPRGRGWKVLLPLLPLLVGSTPHIYTSHARPCLHGYRAQVIEAEHSENHKPQLRRQEESCFAAVFTTNTTNTTTAPTTAASTATTVISTAGLLAFATAAVPNLSALSENGTWVTWGRRCSRRAIQFGQLNFN
jgi:hypothetical protein